MLDRPLSINVSTLGDSKNPKYEVIITLTQKNIEDPENYYLFKTHKLSYSDLNNSGFATNEKRELILGDLYFLFIHHDGSNYQISDNDTYDYLKDNLKMAEKSF